MSSDQAASSFAGLGGHGSFDLVQFRAGLLTSCEGRHSRHSAAPPLRPPMRADRSSFSNRFQLGLGSALGRGRRGQAFLDSARCLLLSPLGFANFCSRRPALAIALRNSVSSRLTSDLSTASRRPVTRDSTRSAQPSGRARNSEEADSAAGSSGSGISLRASARSQSEASSSASSRLAKGAGNLPDLPAISRSLAGMSLSSRRRNARRAAARASASNSGSMGSRGQDGASRDDVCMCRVLGRYNGETMATTVKTAILLVLP